MSTGKYKGKSSNCGVNDAVDSCPVPPPGFHSYIKGVHLSSTTLNMGAQYITFPYWRECTGMVYQGCPVYHGCPVYILAILSSISKASGI